MSDSAEFFKCPLCDSELDENYYCSRCNRDFSEEVNCNYLKEGELTPSQIEQQDFVDNTCLDFLQKFVPDAEYDGEQIGIIRDALIDVLTRYYSMPEYEYVSVASGAGRRDRNSVMTDGLKSRRRKVILPPCLKQLLLLNPWGLLVLVAAGVPFLLRSHNGQMD